MNKASIDTKLICNICQTPFNDPCCTSCDIIYCRKCIIHSIPKRNGSCPHCRQTLSIDTLRQIPRSLQNRLDRLHVKCLACGQTELERGGFDEHIQKVCPKTAVSCSLPYVKCTWTGQRDQLKQHIADCRFKPVALVIIELMNENKGLEDQVSEETIKINEQQNEVRQFKEEINQQRIQIDRQHTENQHLKDQEKQQAIQILTQQNVIEDLIKVFKQQTTQIEEHQNENQQLQKQVQMLSTDLSQELNKQNETKIAFMRFMSNKSRK
jgi:hypothetical protein